MSTLISINLHTLGCRRSAQKKSAKSQDDPEDLRKQRILYENYIRKNKRDKILEGRRKVLEKLNWTVDWSDDEEDTEEGKVSVESLVNLIVEFESKIKPCRSANLASHNDLEADLNNLSHMLDICRRKLSKEVDLTLGSTARYRKPVPGALVSVLSCPPMFEVILRLLVNSHSSPTFATCSLTITRELTAILSDLTRFDIVFETLLATSTSHIFVESLLKILQDVQKDIVCFYNAFNILNHIVSSKLLDSHVNHQTLFASVLSHLTRALNVYGPEENVINLYIKSMTQLLIAIIQPLFKQQGFIDDQNFCITFGQILSVLESLFSLNDHEVAFNVMKVLALLSQTSKGLQLLFQRQSLTLHIIKINESFVDFTCDQIQLKVAALSYEVIANILRANPALCTHFVNEKFFEQAYHAIRSNDYDLDFNVSRILLMVIKFEPRAFELFFERKLTDYFSSIFFMSDNRTQAVLLEIIHEMSVVANPEQAYRILKAGFVGSTEVFISVSEHGYENTHKVLQIHQNLLLNSVKGNYQEEALDICSGVRSHLEKLITCKNGQIVEEAIHLLEVYFDPPSTGSFPSPTSRVH